MPDIDQLLCAQEMVSETQARRSHVREDDLETGVFRFLRNNKALMFLAIVAVLALEAGAAAWMQMRYRLESSSTSALLSTAEETLIRMVACVKSTDSAAEIGSNCQQPAASADRSPDVQPINMVAMALVVGCFAFYSCALVILLLAFVVALHDMKVPRNRRDAFDVKGRTNAEHACVTAGPCMDALEFEF